MSWIYLIAAIVFEVLGTTAMKLSDGFTKVIPSVVMGIFYVFSLMALTFALKKFDVGMTYAIWSGVGMVLIALIGVYYFKEPMNMVKLLSIILIVIGVIGLNLGSKQI